MVEAIAKCNFSGNNDDLLAINAGDLIKVRQKMSFVGLTRFIVN